MDTFGGLSKNFWVNRSLRAAEKIVSRVAQDWRVVEKEMEETLMDFQHHHHYRSPSSTRNISYEELLRKVAFLHKCLVRYEHLKYLVWKVGYFLATHCKPNLCASFMNIF